MLRLRPTTDRAARTKNGQPAHKTTGVASANWIQIDVRVLRTSCKFRTWPAISRPKTGSASAKPIQNRRVMSRSSSFGAASAVGCSGSSAMPQIGHEPGPGWRISGCIGQVKIVPGGSGVFGGDGEIYWLGSATNFARQPALQKQ